MVIGLPDAGKVFVFDHGSPNYRELRPPIDDDFAEGVGFGASVAIHGGVVSVGAVRTSKFNLGVEQPSGVFTNGGVYTFNFPLGVLAWHLSGTGEQTFGHSVSVINGVVSYGVYHGLDMNGGSVRLRDATRGEVVRRFATGDFISRIPGPTESRSFGAELSGHDEVYTTSVYQDTLEVWAIDKQSSIRVATISAMLNGIPASHFAAVGLTIAISAGGGFSSAAGRTKLIFSDDANYEIPAGGPVSLSEHRLSVLSYAAPEDQPKNRLLVYKISRDVAPEKVMSIDHVIGAAIDVDTVFAVLSEPEKQIKLCMFSS